MVGTLMQSHVWVRALRRDIRSTAGAHVSPCAESAHDGSTGKASGSIFHCVPIVPQSQTHSTDRVGRQLWPSLLLHQRVRASDTDVRSGDDITWMLMAVDVGNGLVLRQSITIDRQIHSQSITRRPPIERVRIERVPRVYARRTRRRSRRHRLAARTGPQSHRRTPGSGSCSLVLLKLLPRRRRSSSVSIPR